MENKVKDKKSSEAIVVKSLDEIGQALKEKGVTLEELMERGREIRGELVKNEYNLSEKSS